MDKKSTICFRQFMIQLALSTFYKFAMTLGKLKKKCANIKSLSVNKILFNILGSNFYQPQ